VLRSSEGGIFNEVINTFAVLKVDTA